MSEVVHSEQGVEIFTSGNFQVGIFTFVPGEPELVLTFGQEYTFGIDDVAKLLSTLQHIGLLEVSGEKLLLKDDPIAVAEALAMMRQLKNVGDKLRSL